VDEEGYLEKTSNIHIDVNDRQRNAQDEG
jgi:hypothetical protein